MTFYAKCTSLAAGAALCPTWRSLETGGQSMPKVSLERNKDLFRLTAKDSPRKPLHKELKISTGVLRSFFPVLNAGGKPERQWKNLRKQVWTGNPLHIQGRDRVSNPGCIKGTTLPASQSTLSQILKWLITSLMYFRI